MTDPNGATAMKFDDKIPLAMTFDAVHAPFMVTVVMAVVSFVRAERSPLGDA